VLPDIQLRLRPDAHAPGEARRSLEALRPRLDDALVDEAELLVSELVSNCVQHADLDGRDSIELRVRGTGSRLHVDVTDPGSGFDPGDVSSFNPHGGWGLWLLERLAHCWGVERGEVTRVWFELDREEPAGRGS